MRVAVLVAVQVLGAAAHGPDAPRPGFIALRTHDSNWKPKASDADCELACGDDAPKNCVPDCFSALYECVDAHRVNDKQTQTSCRHDILSGIKKVRDFNIVKPAAHSTATAASASTTTTTTTTTTPASTTTTTTHRHLKRKKKTTETTTTTTAATTTTTTTRITTI